MCHSASPVDFFLFSLSIWFVLVTSLPYKDIGQYVGKWIQSQSANRFSSLSRYSSLVKCGNWERSSLLDSLILVALPFLKPDSAIFLHGCDIWAQILTVLFLFVLLLYFLLKSHKNSFWKKKIHQCTVSAHSSGNKYMGLFHTNNQFWHQLGVLKSSSIVTLTTWH